MEIKSLFSSKGDKRIIVGPGCFSHLLLVPAQPVLFRKKDRKPMPFQTFLEFSVKPILANWALFSFNCG